MARRARGRSVPGVSSHAVPFAAAPAGPQGLGRLRAAAAAIAAGVLGAAPHVLHHVGPLAGAALLAGVAGKLLFGLVGFAAAVPILRRLRRRTGSWRVPAGVLTVMIAMFTFSSLVVGPALTGNDDEASPTKPGAPGLTRPLPAGHDAHHR